MGSSSFGSEMQTSLYLTIMALVAGFWGSNPTEGQPFVQLPPWTEQKQQEISEFIDHTSKCNHIMGTSMAVVYKGQVGMERGFGFADFEEDREADETSRFCVGSLSKTFTATLIGILLDESSGKYSWDSLVTDIMGPDFQFWDELRTQHATLRDLLAHKMALATYDGFYFFGLPETASMQDMCRRLRFIPPAKNTTFRQRFMYHNLMYMLLSCIAEKLGDGHFEHLMRDNIFKKLGMDDSVFLTELREWDQTMPAQYVWNWKTKELVRLHEDITYRTVSQAIASGGLCSAATDMSKWMLLQLQSSDVHVINSSTLKEMHSAQMATGYPNNMMRPHAPFSMSSTTIYGLGWYIGTYEGYRTISHSGMVGTFSSLVTLFPDMELGIYTATNSLFSSAQLRSLHSYITDTVLDETVKMNVTLACKDRSPTLQGRPQVSPQALSPDAFNQTSYEAYVGTYGHPLLGNMSVYQNGTSLWAVVARTGLGALVRTDVTQPDTFYLLPGGIHWYIREVMPAWKFPFSFQRLEGGKYQELVAQCFDHKVPPVYRRDLQWDDVPLMREFSLSCNGIGAMSINPGAVTVLAILVVQLMTNFH